MLKKRESSHIFIPMGESVPPELFQNRIVCEYLSSAQAAKYLGITENALRIKVCRGHVQAHRLGRRLRFHIKDLESLYVLKGSRDD